MPKTGESRRGLIFEIMGYKKIGDDLRDFFANNKKFFLNERDLQIELILFLRGKGYEVHPEYHIPISEILAYEWKNDKMLSVDLVVKDFECGYVPIELKYKHKDKDIPLDRFGENLSGLFTNQAAQNLGRYSFWKDVRRVEHLINRFSQIKDGGYVMFITDDDSYQNLTGVGCQYLMFAMNDDYAVGPTKLDWVDKSKCVVTKPEYPGFNIAKHYDIKWETRVTIPSNTVYNGLILKVVR